MPPGVPSCTKWVYIAIIVAATAAGEVIGALGMRSHGEIRDFRPNAIGRALAALSRNRYVIASVFCMAISFAYMEPAHRRRTQLRRARDRGLFALETAMARFILKERASPGFAEASAALVIGGVALVSPS